MSEYRRFIAYFYEYIDGRKQKNAGFVKVELRNGIWRLLLRLSVLPQPMPPIQVYGFVREAGYLLGLPLGTIRPVREVAEEWAFRADAPVGRGKYYLGDLAGIWIESEDGRNFATVWDEEGFAPELFALEPPQEKPRTEGEKIPEALESDVTQEESFMENPDHGTAGSESSAENPDHGTAGSESSAENLDHGTEGSESEAETSDNETGKMKSAGRGSDVEIISAAEEKATPEEELERERELEREEESKRERELERERESEQEQAAARRNDLRMEQPQEQPEALKAEQVTTETAPDAGSLEEAGMTTDIRANCRESSGQSEPRPRNAVEELFRKRTHFQPFADEEIRDCVMILPCDIVRLQQENWKVGRSSFLQHGFYQYRHLLLGVAGDGTYLLGVPGVQNPQETYMARMFGYDCFKVSARRGCGQIFGYWCRKLQQA